MMIAGCRYAVPVKGGVAARPSANPRTKTTIPKDVRIMSSFWLKREGTVVSPQRESSNCCCRRSCWHGSSSERR